MKKIIVFILMLSLTSCVINRYGGCPTTDRNYFYRGYKVQRFQKVNQLECPDRRKLR
jgi:hypothetical protein